MCHAGNQSLDGQGHTSPLSKEHRLIFFIKLFVPLVEDY